MKLSIVATLYQSAPCITKVFNAFEGSVIICPDAKTKRRIDYLKNFGCAGETINIAPGINGKTNEFSTVGLLQLKRIDEAINPRAVIFQRYTENLKGI